MSTSSPFDLTGRRALVTGGSVSIGRAIALGLATAGARVAVQSCSAADREFGFPAAARDTVAEIEKICLSRDRSGSACAVAIDADFARGGEAKRAVAACVQALGGIDILVVCASIQSRSDFFDVTPDQLQQQYAVNFASTVELLQAGLPDMLQRKWGRVLSIGSVNQVKPEAQLAIYAALKAAQHNLVINLARQHAAAGITLNTLSPGLVATERNRWRRRNAADWQEIQANANPMGRAGSPDDMVGAALLLCSAAGAFITGADLQATGGGHL